MKAENNTLEKQMEVTLKKLARKLRKDDDPKSEVINATARLLKEYRKFIRAEEEDDESESNDYYTLLESPDGPPICDPSKNKIVKRKIRR